MENVATSFSTERVVSFVNVTKQIIVNCFNSFLALKQRANLLTGINARLLDSSVGGNIILLAILPSMFSSGQNQLKRTQSTFCIKPPSLAACCELV